MLKCYNFDIVCQEIPSEVTLAFNITNCPIHCPGCHSEHLWQDVGKPLDEKLLSTQIDKYLGDITCVSFMGGDASYHDVEDLCRFVRAKYPDLKTSWWSGRKEIPSDFDMSLVDFIKVGPYIEELGGLKSPKTNQALYRVSGGGALTKVVFSLILAVLGLFSTPLSLRASSLSLQASSESSLQASSESSLRAASDSSLRGGEADVAISNDSPATLKLTDPWRFTLDLYDHFYFDNREFKTDKMGVSETLFGNVLLPTFGLIRDNGDSWTALRVGALAKSDMGVGEIDWEIPVYLEHHKGNFSMYAGKVHSKYFYGDSPTVFFSDEAKFNNNIIDGIVVRWDSDRYKYLLGCDWMGVSGPFTRERFLLYTEGRQSILPWLRVGFNAYYYHLACSWYEQNVVDNGLIYPHIDFVFKAFGSVAFDLRIGAFQALQQERRAVGKYVFPLGAYSEQNISWRNFYLQNSIYSGDGLQPYYHFPSPAGVNYGELLYPGDHAYGFANTAVYDRLKMGYSCRIFDGFTLDTYCVLHMLNSQEDFGFTQVLSLKLDLSIFK